MTDKHDVYWKRYINKIKTCIRGLTENPLPNTSQEDFELLQTSSDVLLQSVAHCNLEYVVQYTL